MAKVTSKLQVTVPKAIANQFGIRPGTDITWAAAGDAIRVVPPGGRRRLGVQDRLALFDEATRRQQRRSTGTRNARAPRRRGWTWDGLYDRGRAR